MCFNKQVHLPILYSLLYVKIHSTLCRGNTWNNVSSLIFHFFAFIYPVNMFEKQTQKAQQENREGKALKERESERERPKEGRESTAHPRLVHSPNVIWTTMTEIGPEFLDIYVKNVVLVGKLSFHMLQLVD